MPGKDRVFKVGDLVRFAKRADKYKIVPGWYDSSFEEWWEAKGIERA